MPPDFDMKLTHYKKIRSTIPQTVHLVVVSKMRPPAQIQMLYDAGQRAFGENRPQEMKAKFEVLPQDIEWHFIGHLQTNKAKSVVGFFEYIHSLDSLSLAQTISRLALERGIVQKVLVQVNISQEQTKHGIAPLELNNFLKEVEKLPSVEVSGLMTLAPLTEDTAFLRKLFSQMHKLKVEYDLKELSMGMSQDYKIALEEGATMIRLGRVLFEGV